ncbi:hypothetical protein DINM_002365 [Dirofilaria immitis]|nr:hypothetical protein [Dirofilaria immitis]
MSEETLLESEEHYEEPLPPHDEEDSLVESSDIYIAINGESEQNIKPDAAAQVVEEDALLGDDDDSDDEEVVVTIGQIKQNVPFSAAKAAGSNIGKLDIDGTPTINGEPIYDLDLAQMEERPWRKPGADITDYFNYGFCEGCALEIFSYGLRQQSSFSSITLVAPISQNTTLTGGRQLQTIPILGQEKSSMDLSSFKLETNQQPIMRTVLTGAAPRTVGSGGTSGTSLSVSTVSVLDGTSDGVVAPLTPDRTPDFTKAPPDFSKPPPVIDITNVANKNNTSIPTVSALSNLSVPANDGPPGVDEPAPPGSSTPPSSFNDINARHIPTVDTSVPPPGFNPMLPPPGIGAPPPVRLGLPNTNVPPPGFSVPPPNFSQPPLNFPPPRFGAPTTLSRPLPLMSRPTFPPPGLERRELKDDDKDRSDRDRCRERERDRDSGDSGEDDYSSSRRRYRRRSRSYSPRYWSSRRHRDDRERDRDSERYREKDRDRESRSRRHRSRSSSPYESSRSSRRKEERDNKDKEKRRNKKEESGTRAKEEPIEEKDDDKREGSERKKMIQRKMIGIKIKARIETGRKGYILFLSFLRIEKEHKVRHRSDDDSPDKREKEKKMKVKEDPSA